MILGSELSTQRLLAAVLRKVGPIVLGQHELQTAMTMENSVTLDHDVSAGSCIVKIKDDPRSVFHSGDVAR